MKRVSITHNCIDMTESTLVIGSPSCEAYVTLQMGFHSILSQGELVASIAWIRK